MFVKHHEDVAGQGTHKSKTQISTKMGLTLFSAFHTLALQCSTALSNAFRMIYLSIYFEMAWFFWFYFFSLSPATVLFEYSCLLTEVHFTWNGNAKH